MTHPPYPMGPPPRQQRRPVRTARVWVGIGLALLAHLLVGGAAVGGLRLAADSIGEEAWLTGALLAEFGLFVTTMVGGILLITKGDRGIGIGLLIGWAVGITAIPVIGFGVCVYALSQMGP